MLLLPDLLCLHYTVQIRLQYTAAEDIHRVAEVAHGVTWNGLEILRRLNAR